MTTWCHFRLKGEEAHRTAEVIKNLGIRLSLREEDGTEHTVPRSAILSQWEETEAPDGTLAAQVKALEAAVESSPTETPAPDTPQIELKALCIDYGIEPRIARRRLRKAFGQVGTGTRWAWALGSPELEQVKALLNPPTKPTE